MVKIQIFFSPPRGRPSMYISYPLWHRTTTYSSSDTLTLISVQRAVNCLGSWNCTPQFSKIWLRFILSLQWTQPHKRGRLRPFKLLWHHFLKSLNCQATAYCLSSFGLALGKSYIGKDWHTDRHSLHRTPITLFCSLYADTSLWTSSSIWGRPKPLLWGPRRTSELCI